MAESFELWRDLEDIETSLELCRDLWLASDSLWLASDSLWLSLEVCLGRCWKEKDISLEIWRDLREVGVISSTDGPASVETVIYFKVTYYVQGNYIIA